MAGLVNGILFGLNLLFFPGKGQISLPSNGDTFYALPGENVTIAWKIDVNVSDVGIRSWTLLPNTKSLADIVLDGDVQEKSQYSPGSFTIKKPSTLILEKVNIQYNGTYRFLVVANGQPYTSDVTVIVLVKPNAAINCTSSLEVNEGDDIICLCEGKGGNPPAEVTWQKDGVPEPGGARIERKMLTRRNVNETDSGTYTCVAKSHTLMNNKSIEVKLNANPSNTSITLQPKNVRINGTFVITCTSHGFPAPKYNITHNGTEISTEKMLIIQDVKWKDAGTYKCFVWNDFGNDSDSNNLTVEANSVRITSYGMVVTWHIVVSLLSGVIIGLFLSCILWCSCRRWLTNGGSQSNPEVQATEVNTTYQELNLKNMNKEDNYQSLRVNAAATNTAENEDDSNYTELNKTRDVENNYQSLT